MTGASQSFRSHAVIALDEPDRVLEELLDHMTEHATVIRTETGARIESPFGTVGILRLSDTILVDVLAPSAQILAMVRHFIAEHVFEFAGEGARIDWTGEGTGEGLPPQFRLLRVTSAFDLTPRMRRVVFACGDPASLLGDAGYHVRLLLPPAGRPPVWPLQQADGRLVWPEGEDALASRVYTIRQVDVAKGTVAIDFVLHAGGHSPGAGFALRAQPGDLAGMMGPGGDGRPMARRLLLLGDEAALPAMARMISEMPDASEITAIIEVADAAEEQPLLSAANLSVIWLHRGGAPAAGSTLLEEALEARLAGGPPAQDFIWAGCETSIASRIRKGLIDRFPERKKSFRIYAYWQAAAV